MKHARRARPARKQAVPVAIESPVIYEDLPLPHVHYPNHYGTFLCFSNKELGELFLCECTKKAIENHILLRDFEDENNWSDSKTSSPLSSHFFPNALSEKSLIKPIKEVLVFKPKLCHRCNLATPTLRYCVEMYGGKFKQFFGWYINQASFRLGVRDTNYIPNYTPSFIANMIEEVKMTRDKASDLALQNEPFSRDKYLAIDAVFKDAQKLERKIAKHIENIAREEFGFIKIGESNASEMILTQLVERIFQGEKVLRHYRPEWLEGLELDIFVPKKKLGIEYQGQQHFYAIKAWGGNKALESQRIRDQRKREICQKLGIKLVEFDYTEPLEMKYVVEKIED